MNATASTPPPGTLAPTPQPTPAAVLEQYKAKLIDLGNLGTRLTAMTTYYVSILSALLGVLAFKDRKLADVDPVVLIVVGVGGLSVSLLWLAGVSFFRQLFRAKLQTLERIELAMPYQTFDEEFEAMKASGRVSWLWMERLVPMVFAVLFGFLLVSRFAP